MLTHNRYMDSKGIKYPEIDITLPSYDAAALHVIFQHMVREEFICDDFFGGCCL